jgi:hypothetical protein
VRPSRKVEKVDRAVSPMRHRLESPLGNMSDGQLCGPRGMGRGSSSLARRVPWGNQMLTDVSGSPLSAARSISYPNFTPASAERKLIARAVLDLRHQD